MSDEKRLVGEIGPEDDPITVSTEPLPDDGTAYSVGLQLEDQQGWRNVRGESTDPDECEHGPWNGVTAAIEGFGSYTTYVVEECERCGAYRRNTDPTFLEENDA